MSEEKVTVSDKEIQEVERQVKSQEADVVKSVEEKIRKEIVAETRAKELEQKLAEQQKATQEALAEAQRAKQESESYIKRQVEERLRMEQEARSKVRVDSTNPFTGGSTARPVITANDVPAIDKASYEMFLEQRDKSKR